MENFIKGILSSVLSDECYNEYNNNFLDGACFKSSLSKVIGIAIIVGSILVKVPQILKIWSNKSAEGISIFGVSLDLFATTANFAYSYVMKFPFRAWGESTFLAVQTAIIASLVLHYGGASSQAAAFLAIHAGLASVLVSGFTPIDVLWFMAATNVPTILAAKTIQIYTNYKNGSTGQLSAVTCLLLFFGNIARIFTSIQETGDFIIIVTYVVSTLANGLLVLQLFWYWSAVSKTSKNKKQKKNVIK